jgi:preprotein translocase subunit SecA
MDTRTGEIFTPEIYRKALEEIDKQFLMEMKIDPTEKQLNRKPPKVGRNDLCPCGSGLKFKKCHLNKPVEDE